MFNSPVFTGIPTAPTADADDNSGQLANTEFVNRQIANGIAASDAMIFKGTLGTGGTISALPSTYLTGWTYRVVTDGTYAGQPCETGDLIVALTDRKGSGNLDSDWTVCQTNIDGAVIQTRKINAGSGLTGGGTLAADRTLNVGAGNGIHVDADSISVKSNTTGSPGTIGKTVTNADGVGVVLGTDSSSAFRGDQAKPPMITAWPPMPEPMPPKQNAPKKTAISKSTVRKPPSISCPIPPPLATAPVFP